MSLAIVSPHVSEHITKTLTGVAEDAWAKTLMKKDKKGKDLSKLFEAVVTKTPWQENQSLKAIAKSAQTTLNNKKKHLGKKAKERFKAASELFKMTAPMQLFTAKIEKQKTAKTLREIVGEWKDRAKKTNKQAKHTESLSAEKKELADDVFVVVDMIKDGLKKKVTKEVPYIAYDEKLKIHGIALKSFDSYEKQWWLDDLAANPKNVIVFDTEKAKAKAKRGAGTALIKHIVRDIINSKKPGDLYLRSLPSAVKFYEKLGFVCLPKHIDDDTIQPMMLPLDKMDTLLQANAHAGVAQAKAPKAKQLS